MVVAWVTYCFYSDRGIVYSARAYKIPECTRNAAGTPLVQVHHIIDSFILFSVPITFPKLFSWWRQILSLSDGERITSIIPVSEFAEDQFLVMLTVNGYIKKVALNSFSAIRSTGIIAIQLVCPLLVCPGV